jgi:RNA polymerase sigma factor (sigma-70 family)
VNNLFPSFVFSPTIGAGGYALQHRGVPARIRRSDSELIKECLNRDQNAWNELIDRYQRLVYSVAATLCQSREDAADVFQQVCMELYRRLSELRDHESLPAWLMTVTRRQAASLMRSNRTLVPLDDEHPDVEDRIAWIENEHIVERAMLDLSDRCRTLIDMLYLHPSQLTYAAISKRLGMPVSSIGPTRARCLEKLRKLLS